MFEKSSKFAKFAKNIHFQNREKCSKKFQNLISERRTLNYLYKHSLDTLVVSGVHSGPEIIPFEIFHIFGFSDFLDFENFRKFTNLKM